MAVVHGRLVCPCLIGAPLALRMGPAWRSATGSWPERGSHLRGDASGLPLLNNGKSCAKSGWPAELLQYAYEEVTMEDGQVSKLYVLAPILAALLNSAFQSGTLPAAVKSSLIRPVLKKGDESDTNNYCPIAVGELLCRLYAAILNSRIVNWAESNGLRAPCQAGFRPCSSTEHQLFALRHFH